MACRRDPFPRQNDRGERIFFLNFCHVHWIFVNDGVHHNMIDGAQLHKVTFDLVPNSTELADPEDWGVVPRRPSWLLLLLLTELLLGGDDDDAAVAMLDAALL
jgi:hypothetical protein